MSEEARISIIVPVYAVEAYLSECIDSLLNQTYKNLEIILVDDESPDQCGSICDKYAKQDSRIKVIHKSNGGAASARNAGIDAATGNYICFVDSDDIVSPKYVQNLYMAIQQHDADIAVCSFAQFTKNKIHFFVELEPVGCYSRCEYLLQFLKHWSCSLLWNKIYRKEVIGSIRMEEGHRIDDEFFTYQIVLNARKIVVCDELLYQYRLRASSVMRNIQAHEADLMQDRIDFLIQRYTHICNQLPELEQAFFIDMLDTFARYWGSCKHLPQIQHEIRAWAKKHIANMITTSLPFKIKLMYIYRLFFCAPGTGSLFAQEGYNEADLFS